MIATVQKMPHNVPVWSKKDQIGRGNPDDYSGVQRRHAITRLCGFFVRCYHFLTSEACGQLRAGRSLSSGFSTPQCLAHPAVESGCEAPTNLLRSFIMQASSQSAPAPYSTLPAIFANRRARSFDVDTLRTYAMSILSLSAHILGQHTPDSPSTEQTFTDLYFTVVAAKELLELSVLLTEEEE